MAIHNKSIDFSLFNLFGVVFVMCFMLWLGFNSADVAIYCFFSIQYIWYLDIFGERIYFEFEYIFCAVVRIKIQRMLPRTTNQILMSNLELLQP